MIGSKGMMNKGYESATGGGGHIHIDVESITLQGANVHIKANGFPKENRKDETRDLRGGSGGYIYIKTVSDENEVDPLAQI
jgi:transcriptional regulator CtsR